MVIYRLPRRLSFSEPKRSFCPTCEHPLSGVDLIPIFSWLSTGGKCRYCRKPIASRYFWVEVLTGSLFSGIWWRYLIEGYEPVRATIYMVIVALLVVVIFVDLAHYIIPDEVNALIFVFALGFHAYNGTLPTALWGALAGWGSLFGIQLLGRLGFGKDAMGDGDIKLMRGVGALVGPLLVFASLGLAVVAGLIGGITGIVLERRKAKATPVAEPESADMVDYQPTPVPLVLLAGAWYLASLDIVALFVPALDKWVMGKFPQEMIDQEDDWKPSATTIPFGPYLAMGTLACMLAASPIEKGMRDYLFGAANGPSVNGPGSLEWSGFGR